MKNKKAELDIIEFLLTYGWAILIVLIAIGALAYFGVLSPEDFNNKFNPYQNLSDKCMAYSNFHITQAYCVNDFFINNSLFEGSKYRCAEAAKFYCKVFNGMEGFECQEIDMLNIQHTINTLSFDNKYCIIDQEYLNCMTVK